MNRRSRKKARCGRESPFMNLWHELVLMPSLSHWSDRSQPYSPETSDVLAWICRRYQCDLPVADKIFQSARSKGVLRFNPVTKLWCGVKGGQP
jgi:hypothetical protein